MQNSSKETYVFLDHPARITLNSDWSVKFYEKVQSDSEKVSFLFAYVQKSLFMCQLTLYITSAKNKNQFLLSTQGWQRNSSL